MRKKEKKEWRRTDMRCEVVIEGRRTVWKGETQRGGEEGQN